MNYRNLIGLMAKAPGGDGGGITFVGAGTFHASANAITLGLPVGLLEDDIMVAILLGASFDTPMDIPGWTQAPNFAQTEAAFAYRLMKFWKRAGSSESAPTASDGGIQNLGQILAFRGCVATGSPWDDSTGSIDTNNNTSVILPGVTSTIPDAYILSILGFSASVNSTANVSGEANSNVTGLAELTDQSSNIGVGGGFAAYGGIKAAAGATGDTTATLASASSKAYWCGALIPA